jgi:glutathione S-transferase
MILIGQYDSPFVRRVAIALRIYGLEYEHRPWSVFADADALAAFNPLRRVPTLLLDDGEALVESAAILDYLDERAGARALLAPGGAERRRQLFICALATGLADKAVSLVYERLLHDVSSPTWIDRCNLQIGGVLDALDAARGPAPFWFGDRISHADIAVACALRFTREAHPETFDAARWTRLAAHGAKCERLEAFAGVVQPFSAPPRKS